MRSLLVIKLSSHLGQDLRITAGNIPFAVQEFVARLAVEAFNEPALPRNTGLDIRQTNVQVSQPLHHCSRSKFRVLVATPF